MKYSEALDKMKQGFDVRYPGMDGFYSWDFLQGRVLVHSDNGKVVANYSERESFSAPEGLLRKDWKVRTPEVPETEVFPKWWEEVDFEPEDPHTLSLGDSGEDVVALQNALRAQGLDVGKPDGKFGPRTQRAVATFQRTVGLAADGIFGDKTAAAMKDRTFPESLTQADLNEAADDLSWRVEAVMAVSQVESSGLGFLVNGLPKILFERHVMRRRMIVHGLDPAPYLETQPNIVNTRTGGYKGGEAEYDRLEKAVAIDQSSAYESASWGAYQIMGYHWENLGYDNVDQFVELMHKNEGEHLRAFTRFIKADSRLRRAGRGDNPDFTLFASIYNGPAYARSNPPYDIRMRREFERLIKLGK